MTRTWDIKLVGRCQKMRFRGVSKHPEDLMHRKLEARKVFAATQALDATVREDISNKIAIIDSHGYVVATNDDWKAWAFNADR